MPTAVNTAILTEHPESDPAFLWSIWDALFVDNASLLLSKLRESGLLPSLWSPMGSTDIVMPGDIWVFHPKYSSSGPTLIGSSAHFRHYGQFMMTNHKGSFRNNCPLCGGAPFWGFRPSTRGGSREVTMPKHRLPLNKIHSRPLPIP